MIFGKDCLNRPHGKNTAALDVCIPKLCGSSLKSFLNIATYHLFGALNTQYSFIFLNIIQCLALTI